MEKLSVIKINRKIVLYFFISVLTISMVSSIPYIYMTDTWAVDQGSNTDEVIFVDYEIRPEVLGITDPLADMICYDWNSDRRYDNCYWDSNGCDGSCNANSCNAFTIPYEMNDDWKAGCDIDSGLGGCTIGVDVNPRICGTCDGIDTSMEQKTYINATMFYDCDDSQGQRSAGYLYRDDFYVVKPKKYDCDQGLASDYDYEGDFSPSGASWLDIKNDLYCGSGLSCSESVDDILITSATGSIPNPCKTKNGYSCSVDGDCTSNKCVWGFCRATDPYCGDTHCDAGEDVTNCAKDCCDVDFTSKDDSTCHDECIGYGSGSFTSGCDNLALSSTSCVDSNTYRTCCSSGFTDCSAGQTCSGGSCIAQSTADLQILEIIPIQVVRDVDMVKDKSGFVRVIAVNNGPDHAVGKVTVTFNGESLEPYGSSTKNMAKDQNVTFDFRFKPGIVGSNLPVTANITFG